MKSIGISWWVEDAKDIKPKPKLFNEDTEVIELFAYVLNEIEKLKIGESFLLRDLFKGYIWNRLSQSQKAELGRLVSDYIDYESYDFEGTRYLSYAGKTKQKQMIFRIVRRFEEMESVPRKNSVKGVPTYDQFNGDDEAHKQAFYRAIVERRIKKGR